MISRNTDNFTGYIIQGEEKIYFHAQDKVFNFITEGVGIFAEFSKSVMKSPDHFLHGYSTDGYQIALYTGYDERKISANYKLRPGIYLVSTANLCSYDMSKMQAIEFIGGTLNNLYQQTQIATKYDEERKCYIKTYPVLDENLLALNDAKALKNKEGMSDVCQDLALVYGELGTSTSTNSTIS